MTAEFFVPDTSQCSSLYSKEVAEKTEALATLDINNKVEVKNAVEDLAILTTTNSKEMAPKDFTNIADTLGTFTDSMSKSDNEIEESVAEGLADTVGAVASAGETKLSVEEEEKNKMIDCVTEVTKKLPPGKEVKTDTIAMIKLEKSSTDNEALVVLPTPKNAKSGSSKLKVKKSLTAPSVAVFSKEAGAKLFPKPKPTENDMSSSKNFTETIDSTIVSVEFDKQNTEIEFELQLEVDSSKDKDYGSKYNLTRTCKFLNVKTSTWDTTGCTTSGSGNNYICACSHNTSFAMILSVAEIADTSQSTASTVLNTINVIFLVLTLVSTAPFKKFWGRSLLQIQIQLCLSLLMAHVSFLILGTAKNDSPGCLPGVIIVQYLFLVVIAWSVCASYTLYEKIVNALKSFGKQDKHYFLKCLLGCWIFPLIMVMSGYVAQILMSKGNPDMAGYLAQSGDLGDAEAGSCWVNDPWKYVSFMIPIYLCLLMNAIMFVMIARIIIKAGKSGSNTGHTREVKALLSISTTVGLPWLVSLFMFGPVAQVFQWIFIIVTGIQGPTMFVCFVIFQEDVLTNLFNLVGKPPPAVLLPPKSKSSRAAPSESSNVKQTSVANKTERKDEVVEINKAAVEYAEADKKQQENIYSNEDVSDKQEESSSSKSNHGSNHGNEIGCSQTAQESSVPEQDEDKEEADDIDIAQSSYPHVPQLV